MWKDRVEFLWLAAVTVAGFVLYRKVRKVMSATSDVVSRIDSLGNTIDKIGTETTGLKAEVQALRDQIANGQLDAGAINAALDRIDTKLKTVDDLVTDAPTGTDTDTGTGGGDEVEVPVEE